MLQRGREPGYVSAIVRGAERDAVVATEDVAPASRLDAVHVTDRVDPATGGPAYSVPRLCQGLAACGVSVRLLSIASRGHPACALEALGVVDDRFRWDHQNVPVLSRLRSSAALRHAIQGYARTAAVVHSHGLWTLAGVDAGRAAAAAGKPLVVSPRGMLAPVALAFSRRKKHVFWRLLQGPAMRTAACLHATSMSEYEEIRSFGLTAPVAVIRNGIDLPKPPPEPVGAGPAQRTILSLGRLHPKKGLDRLIHAWARLEARNPEWRVRIVGPDEGGHAAELRALATALGIERVAIEPPVFGAYKYELYRAADLFVLPSLNENFGLTVAEALASGTPVIATKGAPWQGLETEGCGWWIDHGVEPLAAVLGQALLMPRDVAEGMGRQGRAWMARDFSWDVVARDMREVYCWLERGEQPPPTVRFD